MKNIWTASFAVLAASLAACAGTEANVRPTTDDMAQRLSALERENAELRSQMGPGTAMRSPPVELDQMVPPPAQRHRLPPQYWAWLHTPPEGCAKGIYSLEVWNYTDYYLSLMIDGEGVKVRGAKGLLPGIPPHEIAYICLEHPGVHNFIGDVFALRYGQPEKVGHYAHQWTFSGRLVWERQRIDINPYDVSWK